MKLVVTALRPETRVICAQELPGTGILSLGRPQLVLEPSEWAIVPEADQLALLAPAGNQREAFPVENTEGVVILRLVFEWGYPGGEQSDNTHE